MAEGMARWANPSSQHAEGRAARAALESARDRIKAVLDWTGELIFTSGATEAAAIALGRAKRPVAISAVEHAAVVGAARGPIVLPVGADGIVDADLPEGTLVAIQQVNSETGVIQPLEALAAKISDRGGLLFADCAQGAAKLPLPPTDMIAISAHKFGGPPGIGALLVRDLGVLSALGQGQEQGYRPGTENLPAALGFAAALEAGEPCPPVLQTLRAELDATVRSTGGEIICDTSPRLATIASYRMPGVSAAAQLMRFDLGGFAVSAGSACSSGSLKRSPVLAAIGVAPDAADEVIRVSFGWTTTPAEVRAFGEAWVSLARETKARAA